MTCLVPVWMESWPTDHQNRLSPAPRPTDRTRMPLARHCYPSNPFPVVLDSPQHRDTSSFPSPRRTATATTDGGATNLQVICAMAVAARAFQRRELHHDPACNHGWLTTPVAPLPGRPCLRSAARPVPVAGQGGTHREATNSSWRAELRVYRVGSRGELSLFPG